MDPAGEDEKAPHDHVKRLTNELVRKDICQDSSLKWHA